MSALALRSRGWHGMAMETRRSARGGGCLLAIALFAGVAAGLHYGEPSIRLLGWGGPPLGGAEHRLPRRSRSRAGPADPRLAAGPAALADPPAGPDDPADDLDRGRVAIGPARISGVVASDRERARGGMEREPLDHQRLVHPEHINAVPQPLRAVAPVHTEV